MQFVWLVITIVFALVDWLATALKWKQVRYLTKPAAMVGLIGWFSVETGWKGQAIIFGMGLLLSLLGDIFLLWRKRYFLPGLVSFLLAHLLYLLGFNLYAPQMSGWIIVFMLMIGAAAWQIFPVILKGVNCRQETCYLRIPVIIYSTVISLMLFSALLNFVRPEWPLVAAALAALGAVLFFASDSTLAANEFVRPLRGGNLAIMMTYHLGQIGIVAGVILSGRF